MMSVVMPLQSDLREYSSATETVPQEVHTQITDLGPSSESCSRSDLDTKEEEVPSDPGASAPALKLANGSGVREYSSAKDAREHPLVFTCYTRRDDSGDSSGRCTVGEPHKHGLRSKGTFRSTFYHCRLCGYRSHDPAKIWRHVKFQRQCAGRMRRSTPFQDVTRSGVPASENKPSSSQHQHPVPVMEPAAWSSMPAHVAAHADAAAVEQPLKLGLAHAAPDAALETGTQFSGSAFPSFSPQQEAAAHMGSNNMLWGSSGPWPQLAALVNGNSPADAAVPGSEAWAKLRGLGLGLPAPTSHEDAQVTKERAACLQGDTMPVITVEPSTASATGMHEAAASQTVNGHGSAGPITMWAPTHQPTDNNAWNLALRSQPDPSNGLLGVSSASDGGELRLHLAAVEHAKALEERLAAAQSAAASSRAIAAQREMDLRLLSAHVLPGTEGVDLMSLGEDTDGLLLPPEDVPGSDVNEREHWGRVVFTLLQQALPSGNMNESELSDVAGRATNNAAATLFRPAVRRPGPENFAVEGNVFATPGGHSARLWLAELADSGLAEEEWAAVTALRRRQWVAERNWNGLIVLKFEECRFLCNAGRLDKAKQVLQHGLALHARSEQKHHFLAEGFCLMAALLCRQKSYERARWYLQQVQALYSFVQWPSVRAFIHCAIACNTMRELRMGIRLDEGNILDTERNFRDAIELYAMPGTAGFAPCTNDICRCLAQLAAFVVRARGQSAKDAAEACLAQVKDRLHAVSAQVRCTYYLCKADVAMCLEDVSGCNVAARKAYDIAAKLGFEAERQLAQEML
eukprot:jgi/Chlat1/7398/Chrsp6S07428